MKSRILKITKVLFAVIFTLCLLVSALPVNNAQAASKMTNKKAQKILKKKIKSKFCKYLFVDIDNDKIDEMIALVYSGKFANGDDKKKSIIVYKVKNNKAAVVLNYSIKGDSSRPSLSFYLYFDKENDCYISVNDIHEAIASYKIYMFGAEEFNMIASIDADYSTEEYEYRLRNKGGLKICSQEEFTDYFKDLEEVTYELTSCSTAVANKYFKKLFKVEFDSRCKEGIYSKKAVRTEYADLDGDDINEMLIWKDDTHADVFFAINPDMNDCEYYVDVISYILENDELVPDESVYDYDNNEIERSEEEIAELAGTWYLDGKEDATSFFYVKEDGSVTYYIRQTGDPEAIPVSSFYIVLAAGDDPHGFLCRHWKGRSG